MITYFVGGLLILWIIKMAVISITNQSLEEDFNVDAEA